jgi:hypothetical protein
MPSRRLRQGHRCEPADDNRDRAKNRHRPFHRALSFLETRTRETHRACHGGLPPSRAFASRRDGGSDENVVALDEIVDLPCP